MLTPSSDPTICCPSRNPDSPDQATFEYSSNIQLSEPVPTATTSILVCYHSPSASRGCSLWDVLLLTTAVKSGYLCYPSLSVSSTHHLATSLDTVLCENTSKSAFFRNVPTCHHTMLKVTEITFFPHFDVGCEHERNPNLYLHVFVAVLTQYSLIIPWISRCAGVQWMHMYTAAYIVCGLEGDQLRVTELGLWGGRNICCSLFVLLVSEGSSLWLCLCVWANCAAAEWMRDWLEASMMLLHDRSVKTSELKLQSQRIWPWAIPTRTNGDSVSVWVCVGSSDHMWASFFLKI